MKHLKKLFFAITMITALSSSAFAASGFEFILNVPLGLNINLLPQYNIYAAKDSEDGTYYRSGNKAGFDAGVSAQVICGR